MSCLTCGSSRPLLTDRRVWLPFPGSLAMCSHRWQDVGLELWQRLEEETRDCISDVCPRCAREERVHTFIVTAASGELIGQVHHCDRNAELAAAVAPREAERHFHCSACPAAAIHQRRLLLSLLTERYPRHQARQWIERPHELLGGDTPRARIATRRWPSVFALLDHLRPGALE